MINKHLNTDRMLEWSDKDIQAYHKLKEQEKKKEQEDKNNRPTCDGIGLIDNDGW